MLNNCLRTKDDDNSRRFEQIINKLRKRTTTNTHATTSQTYNDTKKYFHLKAKLEQNKMEISPKISIFIHSKIKNVNKTWNTKCPKDTGSILL